MAEYISYTLEKLWALVSDETDNLSKYADIILSAWKLPSSYTFIIHAYVFRGEGDKLIDTLLRFEHKQEDTE